MVTTNELYELVRKAWSQVPTPARKDLGMMEWMWGKSSALAFMGIAPIDVDTDSSGFHASTPLMHLPRNCQQATIEVARHLAEKHEALSLNEEQVYVLLELAKYLQQ